VKTAVLGGGAWGTALAAQLARNGHPVALWLREAAIAEELRTRRTNHLYLGDVVLPEGITPTLELGAAVVDAEAVVVAIPSQFARGVYAQVASRLAPGAVLVSATKGFELDTLLRMSEVAAAEAPGHPIAALSGPSFALEVARGQPTAVVVASAQPAAAEAIQLAVSSASFRAYASDDLIGVELAGALKNVVAIAAGILDGLGYGHNTTAALITRGLAEIARLVAARGGRADTVSGLAGLGDLVLTCTGALSRNRRLGQALGAGRTLAEAQEPHQVAEGVRTTLAACAMAAASGVELPICERMRSVLHEGQPPRQALEALMLRSLKRE
jgi:glycerol-3-phosphate dehydrogenase (NAD(P)+)